MKRDIDTERSSLKWFFFFYSKTVIEWKNLPRNMVEASLLEVSEHDWGGWLTTLSRLPFPWNTGRDDLSRSLRHLGCSVILNTQSEEKHEKGSTWKPDVKHPHKRCSEKCCCYTIHLGIKFLVHKTFCSSGRNLVSLVQNCKYFSHHPALMTPHLSKRLS